MRRALRHLQRFMEDRPILANSALSLGLWTVGDILAQLSGQKIQHDNNGSNDISKSASATKTETGAPTDDHITKSTTTTATVEIDWMRTFRCASYGAVVTGPLLAVWYPLLDRLCVRYNIVRYGSWAPAIAKVVADECVLDPPTIVLFFGFQNVGEGGTLETFRHKLEREFFTSWAASLIVWPPVLLGTFRFLPLYAQAPLINACCIVWDGFLSYRNAMARRHEEELLIAGSLQVKNERFESLEIQR